MGKFREGLVRAAGVFFGFVADSARGFMRHRSSLHAAGLTYFSLMSLAPVVCLILLLAKTCGVGDIARNHLNGYIDSVVENVEKGDRDLPQFLAKAQNPEQLAARRQTAADFAIQMRATMNSIFDRVGEYDVRRIGLAGVLMLLWTVVSMLGMVEVSLNEVWEIPKSRPLPKRVAIYAVMALVLPALALLAASMPILHLLRRSVASAFATLGATAWPFRAAMAVINSKLFGWSLSFVFATMGFAFFLSFMPNRHVKFSHALKGGVITAFLFGCWLRLCAVAQIGISRSSAMYGSFAVLPIVLTWIYISWQIILFGGSMTRTFSEYAAKRRHAAKST